MVRSTLWCPTINHQHYALKIEVASRLFGHVGWGSFCSQCSARQSVFVAEPCMKSTLAIELLLVKLHSSDTQRWCARVVHTIRNGAMLNRWSTLCTCHGRLGSRLGPKVIIQGCPGGTRARTLCQLKRQFPVL